jgi:hypothetical protein
VPVVIDHEIVVQAFCVFIAGDWRKKEEEEEDEEVAGHFE